MGFTYSHYKGSVNAYGDIYATLYDSDGNYVTHCKDKGNNGNFLREFRSYIDDDEALKNLIESEQLVTEDENWLEIELYDTQKGRYVDLGEAAVLDADDVLDIDFA